MQNAVSPDQGLKGSSTSMSDGDVGQGLRRIIREVNPGLSDGPPDGQPPGPCDKTQTGDG